MMRSSSTSPSSGLASTVRPVEPFGARDQRMRVRVAGEKEQPAGEALTQQPVVGVDAARLSRPEVDVEDSHVRRQHRGARAPSARRASGRSRQLAIALLQQLGKDLEEVVVVIEQSGGHGKEPA